jgi:hypothetical protein
MTQRDGLAGLLDLVHRELDAAVRALLRRPGRIDEAADLVAEVVVEDDAGDARAHAALLSVADPARQIPGIGHHEGVAAVLFDHVDALDVDLVEDAFRGPRSGNDEAGQNAAEESSGEGDGERDGRFQMAHRILLVLGMLRILSESRPDLQGDGEFAPVRKDRRPGTPLIYPRRPAIMDELYPAHIHRE